MLYYILVIFLFIALLYASVGFGGGSSYIAILVLASIPFTEMRSISLSCNITVVAINIYHHWREKNIPWATVFRICSLSMPMTYVGSLLKLEENVFLLILGITLIATSLMMVTNILLKHRFEYKIAKNHIVVVAISGGIGFLSGITGIGGGIFLSPILYLMRFDTPQKIVAISGIFIAINSIAGIGGLIYRNQFYFTLIEMPLLIAVLVGGFLGNMIRFKYFSSIHLTLLTALLVLYVGIKLVWVHY